MLFSCSRKTYDLTQRALILGILNVTPDSCSDGNPSLTSQEAVERGLTLIAKGADIIDIGGESTRPGAASISAEEEMDRVIPVIQELHQKTNIPISIDTSKAIVAQAAMNAGASIINDVTALSDPNMGKVAATTKAGLILMHMQGTPRSMQAHPDYPDDNVIETITNFLERVYQKALHHGVQKEAIVLDPGIGFGKRAAHNWAILNAIPKLTALGAPLLIGHSRKWFLNGKPGDYSSISLEERFIPSIAVTSVARYHGAKLFRVHDPLPHREAIRTIETLLSCYALSSN